MAHSEAAIARRRARGAQSWWCLRQGVVGKQREQTACEQTAHTQFLLSRPTTPCCSCFHMQRS